MSAETGRRGRGGRAAARRDDEAAGEGKRPRNVVPVKIGDLGRPLWCDARQMTLRRGDRVVVDDRRGGAVALVTADSQLRSVNGPLARIVREATSDDLGRLQAQQERERQGLAFAREQARRAQLKIKLFRIEIAASRDRALVFFAAENRVDFRELARVLSAHLKMRVEMRQVGVRDEAKMVGGIGSCGRELCCTSFLQRFEPVSIRMAKHQNLALTPSKISGQCGRLKCCLVYEDAAYAEAARGLPKLGKTVQTPQGMGKVHDVDILRGRIRVFFPDRPPAVFAANEVERVSPPKPQGRNDD